MTVMNNLPDLSGKRIAVGGATGDVGIEIVAALLECGAEVLAIVRSSTGLASLGQNSLLRVVEGFPKDDDGVTALRKQLAGIGAVHGCVAAIGPWFHGPTLAELPKSDWDKMITASLTSHFLFAKSVLPALTVARGQHVMINGGAASAPVPNSGVVSVLARAQTMVAEVLSAENPNVGVHTVLLNSVIATRSRPTHHPSWITAREVGYACAGLFTPHGRLSAGTVLTLNPKSSTQEA
jgi:NAD(P)-dependent dehydrogenase (short-subunit alcohol dehydrogenase family)